MTPPRPVGGIRRSTVHPALLTPPGKVFVYNNFAAYSLASLVIERAGGAPFDTLVEDMVFAPAGMTTASYDPAEFLAADHANGTIKVGTALVETDTSTWVKPCPVELGPGGLVASATDVAKMMAIHIRGGSPLLSAASEAALRDQVDTRATPDGNSRYGLGVYRDMHHGTEVFSVWMFGDQRGEIVMAPSLGWGIVVGINANYAYPGSLAWEALDRFFPELPDSNPDFSTPPDTWTRYEWRRARSPPSASRRRPRPEPRRAQPSPLRREDGAYLVNFHMTIGRRKKAVSAKHRPQVRLFPQSHIDVETGMQHL